MPEIYLEGTEVYFYHQYYDEIFRSKIKAIGCYPKDHFLFPYSHYIMDTCYSTTCSNNLIGSGVCYISHDELSLTLDEANKKLMIKRIKNDQTW